MPNLSELRTGQSARVEAISGDPSLIQRLSEFGLFEGEVVEYIAAAPLGDPLEFRIGNTRLSLRKNEASQITVTLLSE